MRKPRELRKNEEYHVTARINRGEFIMKEDRIKELFLEYVKGAINKQ